MFEAKWFVIRSTPARLHTCGRFAFRWVASLAAALNTLWWGGEYVKFWVSDRDESSSECE
jgi:hypothetical protein